MSSYNSPFGLPFDLCQPSSPNFIPWMWPSSLCSTWPGAGSNQLFGSASHEPSQEPYAVEEKFKVSSQEIFLSAMDAGITSVRVMN